MKNWYVGGDGRTQWARECDYPNEKFNVYSASKVMRDPSKCVTHCLSVPRCTHFGWTMYTCWVKDLRGAPVVQTVDKSVLVCGFIPVR